MSKDRAKWTTCQFSEVCNVNPRYKLELNKEYNYVEMAAVSESSPYLKYVQQKKYTGQSSSKFKKGDVLFARITPCTQNGKTAHVTDLESEYGFGSTEFIVLSPKEGMLLSEYLYYFVKDNKIRNRAIARMVGTTGRQRVPNDFFREELEIELPPIQEQRKIVTILSSIDEVIEKTESIIEQTEEVKKGLIQQLFTKGIGHMKFKNTNIGEIPEEWEVVALGDIAEFINGRGFKPHEWSDSGLPIIRIQNLNGGQEFNYYEGEFNPKILIEPDTLLFAWSGSRGTSFGPHIWKGVTGVLNYHTWKVVNNKRVIKEFLYYSLRHITTKIENDSHGASALVHMQKSAMENYKIALPSLAEQEKLATVLLTLDNKLVNEKTKLDQLQFLKKGLMQSLLIGKIRVKIDGDEVIQA
ncbi:hypothetical protein IIS_05131 [Bacillus cereus VD131]|nr:hypothetical protein IIS_05131 [Bacillus cereus VD131]